MWIDRTESSDISTSGASLSRTSASTGSAGAESTQSESKDIQDELMTLQVRDVGLAFQKNKNISFFDWNHNFLFCYIKIILFIVFITGFFMPGFCKRSL